MVGVRLNEMPGARPAPVQQSYPSVVADRLRISRAWGEGRYAVASDFHVPFHSAKALDQMLAMKGTFDGCLIVGDLFDAYNLSRFRKEQKIPFENEVRDSRSIVLALKERFGRVLYNPGNHEDRMVKSAMDAMEGLTKIPGLADLASTALKSIQSWYGEQFPGITIHHGWFVQLGRVICAHADSYSSLHGKTAENLLDHFLGRAREYSLKDISCVTQSHTHRHSGPHLKRGIFLWELGSMCGPLDYQLGARANKGQTDTSWAEMVIKKDGSLDFNKSRSYYLDE